MNHYVYRITNVKLNKHYYGTRTSKNKTPEKDIGVYYLSSSKDKDFIKDQKENSQDYKYKIIKKFNTREEAIELEVRLHNKFNVGINESFYNRSKQISTGFDRLGIENSKETREKISVKSSLFYSVQENRDNLSILLKEYYKANEHKTKDTISVRDCKGECFRVHKDDPRYISGELVGHNLGMNHTEDTKIKIAKTLKEKKVNVGEKNGNFNKIWCTAPDFKQKQKTEEEFLILEKEGWLRGRIFKITVCPHCKKKGKGQAMKRYHFDNCKYK